MNSNINDKLGKPKNKSHTSIGQEFVFNSAVHIKKQMQSQESIEVYVDQYPKEVVFVDWINYTIYFDKVECKKRRENKLKPWILMPENDGPISISHTSINRTQNIECDLRQKAHEVATSYQDDVNFASEISLAEWEEYLFDQLYRMRFRVPAIHTVKSLDEHEGSATILDSELFQLRNTPVHSYVKNGARFF